MPSSETTSKPPAAIVTPPHSTETVTCQYCKSEEIYTDWAQGDVICTNCGVVLEESLLDEAPEWNNYDGDVQSGIAKQRTAGPVNADGTLAPTGFSATTYGGGTSNASLRHKLARIQHVRDHQLEQQQRSLYESVSIDLELKRKRKLQSFMNSDEEMEEEEFNTTTDAAPPKNMVLIEEHMEQQLELQQAQLDERLRLLNQKKWTLRDSPCLESDDEDDDLDGKSKPIMSRRKRKKRTKKQIAEFEQAQSILRKAVDIVKSFKLATSVVDTTLSRFQQFAATNDKLPNAACAAILQGTCGKLHLDAFDTTKPAVLKMTKQLNAQFPKWNMTVSTSGVLDRLKDLDTTIRDATLQLDCPNAASVLAGVYFCSSVSQKLVQLGLTTTCAKTSYNVPSLAKQAGIPASRIRSAYKTANRDHWLDQIASVMPQATIVRKLLPNKAV